MNKFKLAVMAPLLAFGIAHATTPCNDFEIKIKNNLLDDLVVRKIHLEGADIQPGGVQKLNKNSAETFTISNTPELGVFRGELVFNTLTLPTKEVRILFDLVGKGLICEHTDRSPAGEVPLVKSRLAGQVLYTIGK